MRRRTALVMAWCLAIGLVPPLVSPAKAQSYTTVSAYQVRMCRSEADRRLPNYSYDQIEAAQVQAAPDTRDRDAATIRWRAGTETGICTVTSSGNILSFTRDDPAATGTSTGTTTRITCESRHTERVECRIPTGARVTLARQLSDNACRLNDSYAQTAEYIWVSGGCRAEFDVAMPGPVGGGGGGGMRITCSSPTNGRQQCPVPAGTQVRFAGQMTDLPCTVNVSYGIVPNFVWVDRGCRAVFETVSAETVSAPESGNVLPNRVTCESRDGQRTECEIRNSGQVQLIRQLGAQPCVRNDSWGTVTGAIWVAKGCRGEFEVR